MIETCVHKLVLKMTENRVVEVVDNHEQETVYEEDQEKEKPFPDQVIDLYEKCLQNGLIISSSFKGVIERKLDSKRRWFQTIYLVILGLYAWPRYCILSFLYSKDEDTRKAWEFYLPNYLEELGLFGKPRSTSCSQSLVVLS